LTLSLLVPLFSVQTTGDDGRTIIYEFHFSSPDVDIGRQDRLFTVNGLDLDPSAGAPTLPVETVLLALQPGRHLKNVEVDHARPSSLEIIENYAQNPCEAPLGVETPEKDIVDRGAWDLAGTYVLEGVEVICLNLRPLVWDRSTGVLTFIPDYSVTIVTEADDIESIGDLDRVRDLVDNPEVLPYVPRTTTSNILPDGSYDHLIITDSFLSVPFQALATWKGVRNELGSVHQNVDSIVVTLQQIRSYSSLWANPTSHNGQGNDTQTLVRNFINAAHQEWGVSYVLIGGDEEIIPSRKVSVSTGGYNDQLPADIYFTGLDGDWDNDNDGVYGEPLGTGTAGEEADLLAEVFVGRATVSNTQEAWNFVNKTISYEKGYVKQYDKDLLFVGELLSSNPETWGGDYKDEVYNDVLADKNLTRTTIYERDGTFSNVILLNQLESGAHLVNHMGHGNYLGFADINIFDVMGLQNDLPFILYTQACMVGGFDQGPDTSDDCIGEEFIKGEHGAVAFIGNSRYGWYAPGSTDGSSQKFDLSFFSKVFDDNVTQLGRALSLSKEELIGQAGYANTIRWVYMELNLLGDPETMVLKAGLGTHDLGVVEMSVGQFVQGVEGEVTARVQNMGQYLGNATVELYADDAVVDTGPVSLVPGESAWVDLTWTPSESRQYELTVRVEGLIDDFPANDEKSVFVVVDRSISGYTIWEDMHVELTTGLFIGTGATLDIRNCTVEFLSSGNDSRVMVQGTLKADSSTLYGSSYHILSDAGEVELTGCDLNGLSTTTPSLIEGGTLMALDTTISGGMGWQLNGTLVEMTTSELIGQMSEWAFTSSVVALDGVDGQGGYGLLLKKSSGALLNLTWSGGERGLTIERCSGLVMHDVELMGNAADLSIIGDIEAHFIHDVERVNLTYGPLVILHDQDNLTVEGGTGSLYLVSCHDMVVSGLHLRNGGQGLTLVGSTGVEVVGNAIENCTVGVMAVDSSGLLWSNDLIDNVCHVQQLRSQLVVGKDYPIGGNHWSDQSDTDVSSGPGQDLPGPDGISDEAYEGQDVLDQYPKVGRCSYVHDIPVADFVMGSEVIDIISQVNFTDASASGSGIANWTWDLGDGDEAYGKVVSHHYTVKSVFTVTLTVTDHKGSSDSVSMELQVINHLPVSYFSYTPSQPIPGGIIEFQDLSSDIDGDLVSWSWDMGDGNHSNLSDPIHSYALLGDYNVTLTVMDTDGENNSWTKIVSVGNIAPKADFFWSPSYVASLQTVNFFDNSSDVDGQVRSWTWDFGDGSTLSGREVGHRYSTPGTYLITLTVLDDDQAQNVTTRSLTVYNAPPTAAFGCVQEVLSMVEVQFKDRSFDPDGRITSWTWDFGDGNGSTISSPKHTYQRAGDHTVTLTLRDDRGATGFSTKVIVVINRLPEASFETPEGEFWSLEPVEFIGQGWDADGEVTSYLWNMGDGGVEEGRVIEHVYQAPGNYTVTLTCVDDAEGETSASIVFKVNDLLPEVGISAVLGPVHPLEMSFTAEALDRDGEVVGYNWSFGDGSFAEIATPVHRYAQRGDYQVTLTVVDDFGERNATSIAIVVWIGDVSMENASCYLDDDGWVFRAELVNEGPLTIYVLLNVTTENMMMEQGYQLEAGERKTVLVPLEDLNGGRINAALIFDEDQDSDPGDTFWTSSISASGKISPWLMVLAICTIVVAVMVAVLIRRR